MMSGVRLNIGCIFIAEMGRQSSRTVLRYHDGARKQ